MKKIIYKIFGLSLLAMLFACHEDVDIWNSSTVDFDGNWFVHYNHSKYGADPFGKGLVPLYTYNTASNNGSEIWLTDDDSFWEYKVRIPVDTKSLTFGSTTEVKSITGDKVMVKIENGKIIPDAVTLPSGAVADSIYFEVWFEDLEGATKIKDDRLQVGGYRKTGFPEDEAH